jgi:SDR family mycofactocin-dependent oxidoreductase
MRSLEGKVALITGAARGQGRSHAVALARQGADIVVCDIAAELASVPYPGATPEDMEETVRQVEAADRRCLSMVADVRDSAQMQAVVDRGLAELGRLDIAVANAGIWSAQYVVEMTDEVWREVVDTNLTGVFNTLRAAARPMIDRGEGGRLMATASVAARNGMPMFANYTSAKWGVIGLMKTLASELGPHNITANAICPAMVRSPMTENQALVDLMCAGIDSPTVADMEQIILTMHKLPTPWIEVEDISRLVTFLASDDARYISGAAIDVSAGQSATWSA